MTHPRSVRLSRRLSWLLRHGATERGLAMDEAGWAAVADVLVAAGITRAELEQAVAENDKRRLQLDGERVRACQGHSLAGAPVTREALEASWEPFAGDGLLWHGTGRHALARIAEQGILPGARTHVHLAEATDSRVGKRAAVDVLVAVSPARLRDAGLPVFRAPNGVLLVRRVPPDCIVETRPAPPARATRRG